MFGKSKTSTLNDTAIALVCFCVFTFVNQTINEVISKSVKIKPEESKDMKGSIFHITEKKVKRYCVEWTTALEI